ncbi:ABC transporter permease [Paralcaligenes ureilyticus]|uniref:Peptide/nickel transport system permease protein n=1 Tax=Paralcaligenes ureilyticus TaxID=627131 RepID=A0A4R3M059_9BURK|nr:ABC transporter permease [Paralcaligenes ureilyticus]TCT06380.1 peptide/nickel transport system permease protein [Paralcaligenes ureilyticus]
MRAWFSGFRRVSKSAGLNLWIGGAITGALLLVAIISFYWTPHSLTRMNLRMRLQPPSHEFLLGTDQFGRDVLSQLMAGAQSALTIGVMAVLLGLVVGVTLGLLAAARGGWIEELTMRASDLLFAFPVVLLAIMFAAAMGAGTTNSMIAIGIHNIPIFARLTRGAAKSIWTRDFVMAARVGGRGTWDISLRHVLPNVLNILVVQATISFAIAILADAALSYLGLGTQPPTPTWGRMLKDAQTFMSQNPYLAIFPGLTIAVTVLGLNLFGDALRDMLDPRFARSR